MELYLYIHEPCIYICVYVFMYTYIYMYINIYIYMYIYMCVCMCTSMYTYSCIYACIPTRTHMCIFQPMCWSWPSRMRMGWSAGLPAGSDRNPPVFIHRYSTCHQHVLVSTHADVYACIHVYIYCIRCGCTYTNMIIYVRILHMAKSCSFTSWKDLKVPPASDRRLRWRHGELKIIHPYEIICILTQMG